MPLILHKYMSKLMENSFLFTCVFIMSLILKCIGLFYQVSLAQSSAFMLGGPWMFAFHLWHR